MIKCFKSIKKIIIKEIISIKNSNVVVVIPKNKKMKRKANAEIPSTRKYCKLIFVLHDLHFPFKRTYERNGILSYQFIFVLQLGH
tara:strand:+ start:981 stop:1235 length:255 start_codon:yes stop_codon:yes gene_type:complete